MFEGLGEISGLIFSMTSMDVFVAKATIRAYLTPPPAGNFLSWRIGLEKIYLTKAEAYSETV
jgi:hypothetical protein